MLSVIQWLWASRCQLSLLKCSACHFLSNGTFILISLISCGLRYGFQRKSSLRECLIGLRSVEVELSLLYLRLCGVLLWLYEWVLKGYVWLYEVRHSFLMPGVNWLLSFGTRFNSLSKDVRSVSFKLAWISGWGMRGTKFTRLLLLAESQWEVHAAGNIWVFSWLLSIQWNLAGQLLIRVSWLQQRIMITNYLFMLTQSGLGTSLGSCGEKILWWLL